MAPFWLKVKTIISQCWSLGYFNIMLFGPDSVKSGYKLPRGKMRIFGSLVQALMILCLPVLLLTVSISWAVNSQWLYEYGFEKYHVSQVTGLDDIELEKAATGLIRYFNSSEDEISLRLVKDNKSFELFNEREVAHLRDVKELFRLNYRLLLGTLVYILGCAGANLFRHKDPRRRAWGLAGGGGLTLGLMLVLGLAMLLNFDRLFWQFHLISFSNDFWQLDPTRDYLIMLFPGGFWFDTAISIALATAGMAVILCGVGGFLIKRRTTH